MILITGANGLIGSYITRFLLNDGHTIKALVKENSDLSLIKDILDDITLVIGDIREPEELKDHMDDVTKIIHCAALVSFHAADKQAMTDINVEGTKNMVNLALHYNIEYFLQISSVAAIGREANRTEVDEDTKWTSSPLNSHYALTKYLSENEVWRGFEEGLKGAILNPSVVLAADELSRSSGKLFQYVVEEKPFYPVGTLNYVDIRDVAKAACICIRNQVIGERFILNAGKVDYQTFFKELADTLGVKAPTIKAGRFMMYMGYLLEGIKSFFSGRRSVITKETIRLTQTDIYFKNEKIINKLNFTFTPLSETLNWAVQQIKESKG